MNDMPFLKFVKKYPYYFWAIINIIQILYSKIATFQILQYFVVVIMLEDCRIFWKTVSLELCNGTNRSLVKIQ